MLKKSKLLLFCILFIGLFFRLYGNNWDQGWHLHPDERFLTMVGVDVKIPSSLAQYLDPKTSQFNPVNKGHEFYVYGTFPVLLNKIVAQYLHNDTYDLFNLQGRVLSGVADFLIILIVYKLIGLFEKKLKFSWSIKYLGAFFYALSVLPIQLSHFFTVDTFLNLFCWLSLYFAILLSMRKLKHSQVIANLCFSGIFFGLALACKISAIYFAPLVGMGILLGIIASLDPSLYKHTPQDDRRKRSHSEHVRRAQCELREESCEGTERKRTWLLMLLGLIVFIMTCYLALRLGSPYYFETNSIFNPQLSRTFINNIETLTSFENPLGYFPPSIQWFSKSYDFPIKNIIFFGVGPLYFLLSLWGVILLLKKKNNLIFFSSLWFISYLIYQSFQFAKTMRYLLFLYPLLAIFAGVGMFYFLKYIKKIPNQFLYSLILIFVYLFLALWPVAFMSIYTKDQSRVTASKWIYENIPSKSIILTEYWDDPLPLMVQDPSTRNYIGKEVHIFDPDTQEKWNEINSLLIHADYYIMSSNRAWGSIMEVPERYPTTSQFYKSMLKNEKGYTLIKEFSSYPSLRYLGIPLDFPDQWAEEAFTVYDHPLVMIYKRD